MTKLRVFKFQTILVLEFKKLENDYKTKYGSFYSHSKAETINESAIDDVFISVYTAILSHMQKCLGKGSGWIMDSVINHNINIPNYNSLAGNSYMKLWKKLDHPRKGL